MNVDREKDRYLAKYKSKQGRAIARLAWDACAKVYACLMLGQPVPEPYCGSCRCTSCQAQHEKSDSVSDEDDDRQVKITESGGA